MPARFTRTLAPGSLAVERTSASRVLYERLDAGDLEEIERQILAAPELREMFQHARGIHRRYLTLAFGMWLGVPVLAEKTGLPSPQPPEEVHAMARGSTAAAGGLYEADLVCDGLESVGADPKDVQRVLDFGCSSGRVVRVLAAAYPNAQWHGCDANEPAIAWASQHLPGIDLFVNGSEPPLPLPEGSLDLVYAISIWSHFKPQLGLRWFEEMRRLIRPGGHLVMTTHGLTSVEFYVTRNQRTGEQSDEIIGDLYRQGWWYAAEFGEQGDWGVVDPGWGTAFLSSEWVLAQLCPPWHVLEFAPGRNQDNQDVYVLRRV